jgi:uncharacterized protein
MKQNFFLGLTLLVNLVFFPLESKAITPYRELRYQGVVGQTSYYTCGPAAIATLLIHYYGIETSEQEILELSKEAMKKRGQDPDQGKGIDALTLQEALKAKGISAQGMKISPQNLADYFNRGGVPIILHVTNPQLHYIVAIAMFNDWVVIADPSWGRKIIHFDELIKDKGFEGVLLIPLTPRNLLTQVRQEQNQTLNWAENRLYKLGK